MVVVVVVVVVVAAAVVVVVVVVVRGVVVVVVAAAAAAAAVVDVDDDDDNERHCCPQRLNKRHTGERGSHARQLPANDSSAVGPSFSLLVNVLRGVSPQQRRLSERLRSPQSPSL